MITWCLQNPSKQKFMMQVKNSRFADATTSERLRQEFMFFIVALKSAQEAGKIIDAPIELIELTIGTFINMCIDYVEHTDGDGKKEREIIFNMMMRSLQPDHV